MITINVFGDFAPQHRGVRTTMVGNAISSEILEDLKGSDFNIVNLESPVQDSSHIAKPIFKNGPNLRCHKEALNFLKVSGFQMATLANNHFYDYGETGVEETLKVCKQYGLYTVGGGRNIEEASQSQIVDIKGLKIGIINICEHEFSIADKVHGGSNPMDPVANYYQIMELRQKVDKILMIIHCGTEGYSLPSVRTKKLCHYYVDLGVDAIVCHHAHRYSGYEMYKGAPIFYGLGNFFFDIENKSYSGWNEGFYVKLKYDGNQFVCSLNPYIQCFKEATVRKMDSSKEKQFFDTIIKLNNIIADDEKLDKSFQKWAEDNCRYYLSETFTSSGRLLKGLYRHHLLPPLASKKQEIKLYNLILCESHRDLLLSSIKSYLK